MSHASSDLISLFDAREILRIFKQTAIFRPACKLARDIESRNGFSQPSVFAERKFGDPGLMAFRYHFELEVLLFYYIGVGNMAFNQYS